MSQKVICPRGHLWDPSVFAGLPATDTPRCPICGDPTPTSSRVRSTLARLRHWYRNNPLTASALVGCLLLCMALAITTIAWRAASRGEQEATEKAQLLEQRVKDRSNQLRQETQPGDASQEQARAVEMERSLWKQRYGDLQSELRKVERAHREVAKQRDEQVRARNVAEDLAKTAEEIRQQAASQRQEAARNLVKMHVAAGTRLMENGDLSASLLWLAEALRLAQKEAMPEEMHRLRLAAVLARCPRPVQVWAHEKEINAVQLSSNGRWVLTADGDGVATVWDTTTGKSVGDPLQHGVTITHASLSANGKRVLTATTNATVHVWNVDMAREMVPALQFRGPVVGLSFSPDGRQFLTVAHRSPTDLTDAELRVWSTTTGRPVSTQALGSQISPRPALFNPDGRQVLTICQDQCARIWDIATGSQVGSTLQHTAAVTHASFSPDGKRVLTASMDGTARVWEASTGNPVTPSLQHGAAVRAAAFNPAAQYVLTVGEDRGVRVWAMTKGEAGRWTLRHPNAVSGATFSPDGRYVLTTCDDGAARVWDYNTGEEVVPALRHSGTISYAAFTPVGDGVLTLSGQVMRLWDLTTGEPPASAAVRSDTGLTVFSSDGRRVLRVGGTTAQVYDTKKNQPVGAPLQHDNKVSAAAFSRDGRRVLTVCHQLNGDEQEGQVRVWETATGKLISEPMIHPRAVLEASFGADGRRVLTACQDRRARLWDADKSLLVGEPMEHNEDLSRTLFTPDENHILTVDVGGGMRLWSATKAEAVGTTWGHRKAVRHLAFSRDGRKLVTASEDGTARVWEADTGRQEVEMSGHGSPVVYATFAPDGKHLVTVTKQRMVRVWDAGSGKPVTSPLRHREAVFLASFSEDGRALVTVAADGLRIWDATTGEPLTPLLPHGPEKPVVRAVSFGKDGRLVLNVGIPGDPSGRWVRELRMDDRPAGELLRIAEVLNGQRLAGAGETTPLDSMELSKEFQEMQGKYKKDFATDVGRMTAWDRRGASECERRRLWVGAVRHLDRLIAHDASADLYARRARANAEMGRSQAAEADYTKALASNPERWDLWAGRAEVEAAQGHWEQAATDYSKAIERKSDRAELWLGRGRAEAERSDWRKAAADLAKAIQLGDQDVTVWLQHALTLLAGGDEASYRRLCKRLLQRFGRSDDETVARSVAWMCALASESVRDLDLKPLVRRAERAVTANPQSAIELRRLAVLLYRTGQFDAALARLQEVTRLRGVEPEASDFLLLAMTTQRLGRGEEAKKWLDKANEKAKESAKETSSPWYERLTYQILHREAESLVMGKMP